MDIITLKQIESIDLEESSLAVTDYFEWESHDGETHDLPTEGLIVKVSLEEDGTTFIPTRLYQKTSTSTNSYPPDDDIAWTPLGSSNKWAMFDQIIMMSSYDTTPATSTSSPTMPVPSTHSSFEVTINTSNANKLCLFNLDATYIAIQFKTTMPYENYTLANFPDTITEDYYPYEFPIKKNNWQSKFLGETADRKTIVIDIPEATSSHVKLTIATNVIGRVASCGQCCWGYSSFIGHTQYGASAGILSYSRKIRNESYGSMYLKKGSNAKKMNIDVVIENEDYNDVYDIFQALDGIACVFQGNNTDEYNYTPFIIFGFTKEFSMILQYYSQSKCNIEVAGLI